MVKKILGWGECVASDGTFAYDDVVDKSAGLSVEEGAEDEALIEGGKAEGRKQAPDKYIIEFDRRVGNSNEVELGFVENAGKIAIIPKVAGACYAELKGCSRKISIKQNTDDGLVVHYSYKTKGSTDSTGKLDDVEIKTSNLSASFTAVSDTTNKNPYEEGWYIKVNDVYVHAFETTPAQDTTYYTLG